MNKKDIPFILMEAVETQIAHKNLDIIRLKKNEENCFYCFVETDENSNNYFKIFVDVAKVFTNIQKHQGYYAIEFKPRHTSSHTSNKEYVTLDGLKKAFQNWVKLIRLIEETPSLYDDNFVRTYANDFYNEMKLLEKDADIAPFGLQKQKELSEYLDDVSKKIEECETIVEGDKKDFKLIIEKIKDTIHTKTKNQVFRNIADLFGVLYYKYKDTTKEFLIQFSSAVSAQCVINLM